MRFFFTVSLSIAVFYSLSLSAQDSTKTKIIDNREFIEHRVQEKETLYSLSRQYEVPIYRIIEHNPPTEFGLEIGSIIYVPKPEKVAQEEGATTTAPPVPTQENRRSDNGHRQTEGEIMHTVETKQTLFSISKLYDVHIDQIRKWNGL
ncbi:MAG: LysM domain-containing protein, partial [Bacteroidota bacterium]